ncbi:MAG: hypothetical protein KDC98_15620 [Planctomycetes bacterium]|nr:hypothetical protein [Planctomycetota bacterium]
MSKRCTHIGSQADKLLFAQKFIRHHLSCERCAKVMGDVLRQERTRESGDGKRERVGKSTILVLDKATRKNLMREVGAMQAQYAAEPKKTWQTTTRVRLVYDCTKPKAKVLKNKSFKYGVRLGPKGPTGEPMWQIYHFDKLA